MTRIVYVAYILFFLILMGLVFVTPIIEMDGDATALYDAFEFTCHQKLSRSLCLFEDFSIGDCTDQTGEYVYGDRDVHVVEKDGISGYKMPVCSRDVGLYGAMLLGGLIYPLTRRLDDKTVYPGIFLLIAMIPIGIDGSLQLVSEMGILPFVYESTNLIRLVTGGIAGFVASFYAIPMLINIFSKD